MTNYIEKIRINGNNEVIGGKDFGGQWVDIRALIAANVSYTSSKTVTHDLSSYIPNDGYSYEATFGIRCYCNAVAGTVSQALLITNNGEWGFGGCRASTYTANTNTERKSVTVVFPPNDRNLRVQLSHGKGTPTYSLALQGYRRLSARGNIDGFKNVSLDNNSIPIGGNNFCGKFLENPIQLINKTNVGAEQMFVISLDDILPKDEYNYQIFLSGKVKQGTNSGTILMITNSGTRTTISESEQHNRVYMGTATLANSATAQISEGSVILPIFANDRNVTIEINNNTSTKNNSAYCNLMGYRRIGSNA